MISSKSFDKIERSFYQDSTIEVAKKLLGNLFVRIDKGQVIAGKIVEVEVYLPDDPASHSYKGKTERNSAMFMQGGFLYVYFTYGMHYCANIVTEYENYGSAVLLRALEPVLGLEIMKKNRGEHIKEKDLANGPAKLCRALGITKEFNKIDLLGNDVFCAYNNENNIKIKKAHRIGIKEEKKRLLRFYIENNLYVSVY